MNTGEPKWEKWNPGTAVLVWRSLGLILLCLLWVSGPANEAGLVLLLVLLIMALARWRFALPGWTVLIDQAVCFLVFPIWPQASFALALPVFEGMLAGQPWFLLPGLSWVLFYTPVTPALGAALIQATFSGWALGNWSREARIYRREADRQRRDLYELESLKSELLMANVQAARTAELTERNRIARQLHDDVGHELTAAVLALRAFEQLWREEDPQAKDMFDQVKERLITSAEHLRETVYNIQPTKPLGADRLREIAGGFTACPVGFQVHGDTSSVPANLWSILEPCLKEALTNVARHAAASRVEISLEANPYIVRLSVHDDGKGKGGTGSGAGIRNLRQRARAAGGSIAVDTTRGFRLVCVLPLPERNCGQMI